jgi:serine/threonine-protein kinase HipA
LGGARPKASVRDRDGALAIAKFPKASDDYPVVRWVCSPNLSPVRLAV